MKKKLTIEVEWDMDETEPNWKLQEIVESLAPCTVVRSFSIKIE